MTETVEVAMATYNGAAYLPEFLASIAGQTHDSLAIVASDDGSTDDTWDILGRHADRSLIRVRNEGPRGFGGNFENALRRTSARYVALADQDDWWKPEKIAAMVARAEQLEARHGETCPVLIFSDVAVVDEELRPLRASLFAGGAAAAERLTFSDYLFGNHVPGCAMLLNRALVARALPLPPGVVFHDWWFSLVASGLGQIGVVDAPLIKYRQHGGNTLGAPVARPSLGRRLAGRVASPLGQLRSRMVTVRQIGAMMATTLCAYRTRYGRELPADCRAALDAVLDGRPSSRVRRFFRVRSAGGRAVAVAVCLFLGSRVLPLPHDDRSGAPTA